MSGIRPGLVRAAGLDIGGVVIAKGRGADTSFFRGDYLSTPAVAGAAEGLADLVQLFEGAVFLISKCSEATERRTREWLAHHDVYARTGLHDDRLRFTRERGQKASVICELRQQGYELAFFCDDTLDVLMGLRGVVPKLYLLNQRKFRLPNDILWTPDWERLMAATRKDLAADER